MGNIAFASASEQLAQLHSGKISAVDLLEVYSLRYQRYNPEINAIVAVDFERARMEAGAADEKIRQCHLQGKPIPPLLGLPMTIKDTIEVTGMATTAGSPSLAHYKPEKDAAVVSRLRAAGAIIFAKTNAPLFASDFQTYNKVYGTTNNPWDLKRTPGGSSGGAAAALAAGLTSLEIGSDLGGSIRNPASYCGVYGHKPSFDIVPGQGHIPPAPGTLTTPDLAVLGPLARSADDLALVLKIIAGPEDSQHSPWQLDLQTPLPVELTDYKVATLSSLPFTEIDESVASVLGRCFNTLEQSGCKLSRETGPQMDLEQLYKVYFKLMAALIGSGLPPAARRSLGLIRPLFSLLRLLGLSQTGSFGGFVRAGTASQYQWAKLNEQRLQMRDIFKQYFDRFDVLLAPVSPTAAFEHLHKGTVYSRKLIVNGKSKPYIDHLIWASLATLCGLPATVVPIGQTVSGLPVGMQIIGGFGKDLLCIEFARKIAAVLPAYRVPDDYI